MIDSIHRQLVPVQKIIDEVTSVNKKIKNPLHEGPMPKDTKQAPTDVLRKVEYVKFLSRNKLIKTLKFFLILLHQQLLLNPKKWIML